ALVSVRAELFRVRLRDAAYRPAPLAAALPAARAGPERAARRGGLLGGLFLAVAGMDAADDAGDRCHRQCRGRGGREGPGPAALARRSAAAGRDRRTR